MNVSVSWLKDYVDIAVDARTLANDLTMHGVKVERVSSQGVAERAVVVGRVLEVERHPTAERLTVCRVDVGAEAPLEIVCGAPNVATGQRVPVALVGAILPNGVKIRRSKIRGVVSNGMICSEAELGLGGDGDGIMVLAGELPVGVPLADVLGDSDVLELEVTPNRPDQLGHVGVAREIAAIYETALRVPTPSVDAGEDDTDVSVTIDDPNDCFRFVARVIRGVTVGPSPAWLRNALERVGVKSINNIVDVTNFVMMELGQPLHGYDLGRLPSAAIGVRRARRGERLEALDGVEYTLGDEHLCITAGDEVVGLAGVIGGAPTRITEATTDVLLESAAFDARAVRRTRRALNLTTDASHRFERGSDREICRLASDRACELVLDVAGGRAGRLFDAYAAPHGKRTVTIRRSSVRRLLGVSLTVDEIHRLLQRLGFQRLSGESDAVTVSVPSHRVDVREEADLVEEVARLYGYDNIGTGWRFRTTVPSLPDPFDRFVEGIADHLVARGHTELFTSSFTDGREVEWLRWTDSDPRAHPIVLKNPLSGNHSCLRTHLLPAVLDALGRNVAHGRREMYVFTVGRVFLPSADRSALPEEPTHLLVARTRPEGASFWRHSKQAVDLFEIKNEIEVAIAAHLPEAGDRLSYDFEPTTGTFRYSHRRRTVVEGGMVPPAALRAFNVEQAVWYGVIDLTALYEFPAGPRTYRPFSEYPPSRRDLSLVAAADTKWAQIEKNLVKTGGRLLESLRVFDVYQGKSLPRGKTAYGVRLSFRSPEGTLTDAEVDVIVAKMVAKLENELGVVVRS